MCFLVGPACIKTHRRGVSVCCLLYRSGRRYPCPRISVLETRKPFSPRPRKYGEGREPHPSGACLPKNSGLETNCWARGNYDVVLNSKSGLNTVAHCEAKARRVPPDVSNKNPRREVLVLTDAGSAAASATNQRQTRNTPQRHLLCFGSG